jgi:hypothetical protein
VVAAEEPLRFRSVFTLLLLAIGLGTYAYFVERPARERESKKQTLLSLDADAVAAITLTYPDREIRLAKDPDAHWRIAAPLEADADQVAVKNLVNAIAEAELKGTIEEPPDDLALYGLDEPIVTIRLQLKDGAEVPTLVVGKETPIGYKAYARKEGDPNVYLTTGAFHSGVKKEVKDVRDKTILDFTDADVGRIILARDGTDTVALQKHEDLWKITKPVEYAADAGEVRSFLSSLRGLRAQDFIDDPDDDLSTYGLAAPRLRVTLSVGEDGVQKSVLLGSEAPGTPKRIYAKRGERGTVYLVGDWTLQNLERDVGKFRDRTVLPFEREAVSQITITPKDGDLLTLERDEAGTWTLKGTTGTPKATAIERFLDDLRQTKPAEIVSDDVADFPRYGLDDPILRISVVGKDDTPIGALLAARLTDDDGKETFYFAREGMPTIFEGRQYMLTRLDKRASDLVESAQPSSADADTNQGESGDGE